MSLSSFHLKGSGWYVTDYGGKQPPVSETASKSETTAKSETATETTVETPSSPPSTAGDKS
jgi:predicted nucleic acid-binding Zn ribbon protein